MYAGERRTYAGAGRNSLTEMLDSKTNWPILLFKEEVMERKIVSSCTSIGSSTTPIQNMKIFFLSFLCHPHRITSGLCNPNTHLKKDFQII